MVIGVEGVRIMMKLATFFAVAFAAVALIATTTFGRVERHPAAQIAPLQMMTGQHLPQTEMADFSLIF